MPKRRKKTKSAKRKQNDSNSLILDVSPAVFAISVKLWIDQVRRFERIYAFGVDNEYVVKLLHIISSSNSWEGFPKQKEVVDQLVLEIYLLSLYMETPAIQLFLNYLTDISRTNFRSKGSVISLKDFVIHVKDTWDSAIIRRFRKDGSSLLSFNPEVSQFLQWLAVETACENGCFNVNENRVFPIVRDIVDILDVPLALFHDFRLLRTMLYMLAQQDPTLSLNVSTKTYNRILQDHVYLVNQIRRRWFDVINNDYSGHQIFTTLCLDVIESRLRGEMTEKEEKDFTFEIRDALLAFEEEEVAESVIITMLDFCPRNDSQPYVMNNIQSFMTAKLKCWRDLKMKWSEYRLSLPATKFRWRLDIIKEFLTKILIHAAKKPLTEEETMTLMNETFVTIQEFSRVDRFVDLNRVMAIIKTMVTKEWPEIDLRRILEDESYRVLPRVYNEIIDRVKSPVLRV